MRFHSQCKCKTAPWTVPTLCGLLKGQTSDIFFCKFENATSEVSISVDSSLSHLKATGTLKHLPIFSWCTMAEKQARQWGKSEDSAKFHVYCMALRFSPQCHPSLSPKRHWGDKSMRDPTLQGLRLPPQPHIQWSLPMSSRFNTSGPFISVPDHRFVRPLNVNTNR